MKKKKKSKKSDNSLLWASAAAFGIYLWSNKKDDMAGKPPVIYANNTDTTSLNANAGIAGGLRNYEQERPSAINTIVAAKSGRTAATFQGFDTMYLIAWANAIKL